MAEDKAMVDVYVFCRRFDVTIQQYKSLAKRGLAPAIKRDSTIDFLAANQALYTFRLEGNLFRSELSDYIPLPELEIKRLLREFNMDSTSPTAVVNLKSFLKLAFKKFMNPIENIREKLMIQNMIHSQKSREKMSRQLEELRKELPEGWKEEEEVVKRLFEKD